MEATKAVSPSEPRPQWGKPSDGDERPQVQSSIRASTLSNLIGAFVGFFVQLNPFSLAFSASLLESATENCFHRLWLIWITPTKVYS